MPDLELPRAYAHPANRSSSSSSSQDQSSSTSSGDRRRGSSSSTSSTSEAVMSSRKRRTRKRYCQQRTYTSSSRSRSRSPVDSRRRRRSSKSKKSASYESSELHHGSRHRQRRESKKDRTSRADRLFSSRPVANRAARRSYDCECGERYGSRKALIHHTIQNHDAEIPCFACNQTLPSLPQLPEHFRNAHSQSLVVCVYCKSVFGKADVMTDDQWKRLKTHMYGELVYAKLAEMQG